MFKMAKLVVFVFAVVLFYAQCIPLDTPSSSTDTSSSGLQLIVKNSSDATNYHLTPIVQELENIDDEINAELEAILPYINFLFDTLFGPQDSVKPVSEPTDEDCLDNMVIQLVPDTPQSAPATPVNA